MEDSPNPNPRMIIGAPQPSSTLEERKRWTAEHGFLHSLLVDIGYYYDHEAPGDREIERKSRGRER
jgi:hypothetical protein